MCIDGIDLRWSRESQTKQLSQSSLNHKHFMSHEELTIRTCSRVLGPWPTVTILFHISVVMLLLAQSCILDSRSYHIIHIYILCIYMQWLPALLRMSYIKGVRPFRARAFTSAELANLSHRQNSPRVILKLPSPGPMRLLLLFAYIYIRMFRLRRKKTTENLYGHCNTTRCHHVLVLRIIQNPSESSTPIRMHRDSP